MSSDINVRYPESRRRIALQCVDLLRPSATPEQRTRIANRTVACGCHDWRFDVRTGKFLDAPELGLTVYPTKLEAGKLFVNLGREETT